jgi:two-component system response regulator QseB
MRILVVEDDRSLREAVVDGLRDAGFAVDAVESGEAAVTRLGADAYDLMILDLGLPGVDGLDL